MQLSLVRSRKQIILKTCPDAKFQVPFNTTSSSARAWDWLPEEYGRKTTQNIFFLLKKSLYNLQIEKIFRVVASIVTCPEKRFLAWTC
jgi:hypothetical protein